MLGPSTCLAIEVPGSARSTVHSECWLLQNIAVAALAKLRRRVMFPSRVLPAKLDLDT